MKGTIIKTYGRYYTVECGDEHLTCVLRGRLRRDPELKKYSDPVAVGDRVEIELDQNGGCSIEQVYTRENIFSRQDGRKTREDLLAANLEYVVIIQAFRLPRLNLRFVDRLLVRCEKEGIAPLICINKLDLAAKEEIDHVRKYYSTSGYSLVLVSAKNGKGITELKKQIEGKLSLFMGTSGVGKSSILNRLYPGTNLRTSNISESTGKGRHTTTSMEMVLCEKNTRIIDTPGLREFGLIGIEPHELADYFPEFYTYSRECAFRPCTHDHEPDCEVKRQVEKMKIYEDRYISYLKILDSLRDYHKNRY